MTAATLGLSRLHISDVALLQPAKLVSEETSLHEQLSRSAETRAELEARHATLSLRKPAEKAKHAEWQRHAGPQHLPPALPRLLCQLAEEVRALSRGQGAVGSEAKQHRLLWPRGQMPPAPHRLGNPPRTCGRSLLHVRLQPAARTVAGALLL